MASSYGRELRFGLSLIPAAAQLETIRAAATRADELGLDLIPSLSWATPDLVPGLAARIDEAATAAGRDPAEISRLYNSRFDDELERTEGMPLSSYDVLLQLARAPGRRLRMSELADAVLLSPSGITRLVDRLEREGLVARVRAGDDARGAYATLTDRGRHRLRAATATHLASVRGHFLDALSDDERRLLADVWARTLENLSDDRTAAGDA